MEKFKVTAISIRSEDDIALIIEGDDLYYYVTSDIRQNVYPAPVALVAARFRMDWTINEGDVDEVPLSFEKRIIDARLNPKFRIFCKQQKELFGKKRFELD
jgi:hypothetical protein